MSVRGIRPPRLQWYAYLTICALAVLFGVCVGLLWPAAVGAGWPEWLDKYDTLIAAAVAVLGFAIAVYVGDRQETATLRAIDIAAKQARQDRAGASIGLLQLQQIRLTQLHNWLGGLPREDEAHAYISGINFESSIQSLQVFDKELVDAFVKFDELADQIRQIGANMNMPKVIFRDDAAISITGRQFIRDNFAELKDRSHALSNVIGRFIEEYGR